jgi:hypothetical protein
VTRQEDEIKRKFQSQTGLWRDKFGVLLREIKELKGSMTDVSLENTELNAYFCATREEILSMLKDRRSSDSVQPNRLASYHLD